MSVFNNPLSTSTRITSAADPVADQSVALASAMAEFWQRWETFEPTDEQPQAWLGRNLLDLLGCPYVAIVKDHQDRDRYTLVLPEGGVVLPPELQLRAFQRLLPLVLGTYGVQSTNIASLLAGIAYHKLLDAFLASEDDAFSLAAGILIFIEMLESQFDLDVATGNDVCGLLNTWLKPVVPWTDLPGIGVVAELFFGPAWCSLFVPEGDTHAVGGCSQSGHHSVDDGYVLVGISALRTMSSLLPGLCREIKAAGGEAVPLLGIEL